MSATTIAVRPGTSPQPRTATTERRAPLRRRAQAHPSNERHTGRSPRPSFHGHLEEAQQYDAYVRGSPLYQNLVRELLARAGIRQGNTVLCLACGTGLDARAALEAG